MATRPLVQTINKELRLPPIQINGSFPMQSYLSDTLQEFAINAQPTNTLIVPSTRKVANQTGRGLSLAPWSKTPVSVTFSAASDSKDSQVITMRPGETIFPNGNTGDADPFLKFEYGCPFGWLGGGAYTIFVLSTPDAEIHWESAAVEVPFHRTRIQIVSSLPTITGNTVGASPNWPISFPWTNAIRGIDGAPIVLNIQQGNPYLGVTPTRTEFRLRMNAGASPVPVEMYVRGDSFMDTDANGKYDLTAVSGGYELNFPVLASTNPAFFPVVDSDADMPEQVGGDKTRIDFTSTDSGVIGQYIDVVRWGVIG